MNSIQKHFTVFSKIKWYDSKDTVTNESIGKSFTDYTPFLNASALKGKRIGVERKQQGKNQYMHQLQQNAIDLIKNQGAIVIEIDYLDKVNELGGDEFEVMQYEFKEGVNAYLSTSNAKVKNLKEVIDFNIANQDKAMPYFKQETLISSNEKKGLDDPKYLQALDKSHLGTRKILDDVININKLDAICGLTMGPACSIDSIYGDRWGDVFLTMPAAASGYPHITVPCGMVYDLPVGFSFFGAAYTEPKLIGIAYAYEQASKKRIKPTFKKSFL